MSQRRWTGAGLAVLFAALVLAAHATPAAAAGNGFCDKPVIGMVCHPDKLIFATPAGALAKKALDAINPANFIEQWAKSCTTSVVKLLDFIQSSTQSQIRPAFDQEWWRQQYAVSFGLALIVLAFLLVVIAAKVGGRSGSVSGVELLRASGWRLVLVVPAIAAAPGLLYAMQQLTAALAKAFADEASIRAGGAIGKLMETIQRTAGDWGVLGGAVTVILVMLGIIALALILLVELAVAAWGLNIVGLILPLTIAMSVYPPWKRALSQVVGVLLGLMLLPAFIYFTFWTIWSSTDSLLRTNAGAGALPLLIYLVVGLLLLVSFPVVGAWLMSMVVPAGGDLDAHVRGAAAASGTAALSPMTSRLSALGEARGKTAEPTGGRNTVPAGGRDDVAAHGGAGPPPESEGHQADIAASPAGDEEATKRSAVQAAGGPAAAVAMEAVQGDGLDRHVPNSAPTRLAAEGGERDHEEVNERGHARLFASPSRVSGADAQDPDQARAGRDVDPVPAHPPGGPAAKDGAERPGTRKRE